MAFGGMSDASAAGSLDLGIPNNVFVQKLPGKYNDITVSLSELPAETEDADSIVVKMKTTESGGGQFRNVELFRGTHPTTGKRCFLRKIRLADSSSGGAIPQFGIQPFQESFSSLDATGSGGRLQDSKRFIKIQNDKGRRQLGEAHDFPDDTADYQPNTVVSQDAFRAAGYESFLAEYEGQECWVRVRNQAKVFYVSAHGWHDANLIDLDPGQIYPTNDTSDPNGLTVLDWQNDKLDTVIMAACSVIDCGYWNEGHMSKRFNARSPGWAWANITKPTTLLLGYNGQSPDAELTDLDIERRDTRILENFYQQLGQGDHPVLAWLRGNARMETRLGDNASAIYGDYYYFIKFKREEDLWGPGYRHVQREIWKVHYNYWDGAVYWGQIDQGPGGRIRLQTLPAQAEGEEHRGVF